MDTAEQIIEFITNRMRMSHVYQPLLIRALVRAGGSATLRQLATALLMEDESQLLYYEDRIKKMPLPILRRHGIVTSDRNVVSLNAGKLSYEERAAIELVCTQQLAEFLQRRGLATGHRQAEYFSGHQAASWVELHGMATLNLLEHENDLIAVHVLVLGE
jgi:hypothetical protein